jgi:hypothetical protein
LNDPVAEPGKDSTFAHSAEASPPESRPLVFDEVSIGKEYRASVAKQSHRVRELEEGLRSQRQLARIEDLLKFLEQMVAAAPILGGVDSSSKESENPSGIRLVTFDPGVAKRDPRKSPRPCTSSYLRCRFSFSIWRRDWA